MGFHFPLKSQFDSSGLHRTLLLDSPGRVIAEPFDGSEFLAGVLDAMGSDASHEDHLLQSKVKKNSGDLSKALADLNPQQQEKLFSKVPEGFINWFTSLSQQTNQNIFFHSLISIGKDMVVNHRPDLATLVFSSITENLSKDFPGRPSWCDDLVASAQAELDPLLGHGTFGKQMQQYLRSLPNEAINPLALGTFATAGLISNWVEAKVLTKFIDAVPAFYNRGLFGNALASAAGLFFEVPTLIASGHLLHGLLGYSSESNLSSLKTEFAMTAILMSALKLAGGGTRNILENIEASSKISQSRSEKYLRDFSHAVLPQFAILTGIMFSYGIQKYFEIGPPNSRESILFDSLQTLTDITLSGALLGALNGSRFVKLHRSLKQQIKKPASENPLLSQNLFFDKLLGTFQESPSWVTTTGIKENNPNLFKMTSRDDKEGENLPSPPSPGHISVAEIEIRPDTLTPEELGLPAEILESPLAKPPMGSQTLENLSKLLLGNLRSTSSIPPTVPIVLHSGERIGEKRRFEVIKRLGAGGFGDVYQVLDHELDRHAVIKVLKSELHIPEILEKFKRESQITANLDHRWVVTVYDTIELREGFKVPVLEYVPGKDLGDWVYYLLHRNQEVLAYFSPEKRLDIFAMICEAVHSAHQRGIVHRDLKPGNIRISHDGQVKLMDWGQASASRDPINSSQSSFPPGSFERLVNRNTQPGKLEGTPGYLAPEKIWMGEPTRPELQDILALGITLYEWMTGIHPMSQFTPGNTAMGEPNLVPIFNKDGWSQLLDDAQFWRLNQKPPSFRQVMKEEQPPFFYELEAIALKAMSLDPAERFQSVRELREAVLMARALPEVERLQQIRKNMKEIESQMHQTWDEYQEGQQIQPEIWRQMTRPMELLKQMRSAWRQGGQNLTTLLLANMGSERWPDAQRIIADIGWAQLIDGGDRIPQPERQTLEQMIRENDISTLNEPYPTMSLALGESAPIDIEINSYPARMDLSSATRIKVIPWLREHDGELELGNYRESAVFFQGSLKDFFLQKIKPGYYVFEFSSPGFTTTSIPIEITLEQIRKSHLQQKPIPLKFELIEENKIPEGFIVVHGGPTYIGHDFYHDGDPSSINSVPLRKISIPTFAVSRASITVADYRAFIESLLEQAHVTGNKDIIRDAKRFIPRETRTIEDISMEMLKETGKMILKRDFLGARDHLVSSFSGAYWRIRKGKGGILNLEVPDKDPWGDPILSNQPISAISYEGAQAFTEWKSKKEGFPFKIIRVEQAEKIGRNSFRWSFPWGYNFNPTFMASRQSFRDVQADTFAQPVGNHPMGPEIYRDKSLYGVLDITGNVRKFTSSPSEEGSVFMTGASVRNPRGPFFYPASRTYASAKNWAISCNGGFNLVVEFPPKK